MPITPPYELVQAQESPVFLCVDLLGSRYWVWMYYLSPLGWSMKALAVNEFLSNHYSIDAGQSPIHNHILSTRVIRVILISVSIETTVSRLSLTNH